MRDHTRPVPGLEVTASLLREAGLEPEYVEECERGRCHPNDYYDQIATQPEAPASSSPQEPSDDT